VIRWNLDLMHDDIRRPHDHDWPASIVMMFISRMTAPISASRENATRGGEENSHAG
jgi:hypothetical protein